jgi:major membrane immunogen (membrane-anchored lipoprotein)
MKYVFALAIAALLTACGTTDPYAKRAETERKYEEAAIDKALDAAPKWMDQLPTSASAVFGNGEGRADSRNMAVEVALSNARSMICYNADGRVSSQTKDFQTQSSKSSNVERVTRSNCNNVDITGAELAGGYGPNPKVIRTGNKYTAFVLLALPTGDANVQRKYKDDRKREEREQARAVEAFKELPANKVE